MELTTLTRSLLFDTYGDMLTEKQRICFDYRYNQDLSLAEIGEIEGISRQGVRDNIVRSEAQLLEMEEKIGAVNRLLKLDAACEALETAKAESAALGSVAAHITELINQALSILKE